MIHPDTKIKFISDTIGYGVVATKFIPKGTVTWVQDPLDTVYPPTAVQKLPPEIREYLNFYSFTNRFGDKVLCWDNGKYVNHSFNPSCFTTPYDFEIAIRDISPGEELTDDYGYLNIEKPFVPLNEGTERKTVYPDDLVTYHGQWDNLIRNCLPYVFTANQPLLNFIPKQTWETFKTYKDHPALMPSVLESYFNPIKSYEKHVYQSKHQ